jgi:hypothetical protein
VRSALVETQTELAAYQARKLRADHS